MQDILVSPGPCHLPIEDGTLSNELFLKKYCTYHISQGCEKTVDLICRYAYKEPFVLRDAANNDVSL